MKKFLVLVIFLISNFVYSDSLSDCKQSLEESNRIMYECLQKINSLEKERDELKEENRRLKILLKDSKASLEKSNRTLKSALERINIDQREITNLRLKVKNLIDSSVEIKTYHWGIGLIAGYPYNVGLLFNYNLHWFPMIGIIIETKFDIYNLILSGNLGLKINFE